MPSWIEKRKKWIEKVEAMIKKGMDLDSIIAKLGREGVSRRTVLEYYNSARGA